MTPTLRTASIWGLLIGFANLVWLYAAYFIGLHTSGIMVFQVFMLIWFAITTIGFILALRAVKRASPALTYWRGVSAGAVAAAVSALVAVVAQIGYFKVIHPAWPEVMVEQARQHFEAIGTPAAVIEKEVEMARGWFALSNYAVSSAMTAFVVGIVLSAIIMLFLRRSPHPRAMAPGAPSI